MTHAGTGRNANESICIKRVSLPCWLLGVTEARILLGNGDLQAGSIIPPIYIKLPIKKIKQRNVSLCLLSHIHWPAAMSVTGFF